MAYPSATLIGVISETAERLKHGAEYAWGNHGVCNCGNLLQVACSLNKQQIMRYAQTGIGEWTEIAEEYCGATDLPLDLLMGELTVLGLTPTDIHNIEYLEDREVLLALPGGFRWLQRNVKEDVIVYLQTFASVLENKLPEKDRKQKRKIPSRKILPELVPV